MGEGTLFGRLLRLSFREASRDVDVMELLPVPPAVDTYAYKAPKAKLAERKSAHDELYTRLEKITSRSRGR